MRATLCGVSGPAINIFAVVKEGLLVSFGRSKRANISIPADTFLSGVHFGVECRDNELILRDLGSSNGTSVNGVRVTEQMLIEGDTISAGSSVFQIQIDHGKADPVEILSTQAEPLFAVLDTARDRKIYNLLVLSGVRYCSLYQGRQRRSWSMSRLISSISRQGASC